MTNMSLRAVIGIIFGTAAAISLLALAFAHFDDAIGVSITANSSILSANAALDVNGSAASAAIPPNTISALSYTLTNQGTINYQNSTGDQIAAWFTNEYAPVDYIHFSGAQYIDTGISQSTNGIGITMDHQYTDITSQSFSILFGARSASIANALLVVANHTSNAMIYQYGTANPKIGSAVLNTNRRTVTISNNGQTATINANTATAAAATFTMPLDIYLGGGNEAGAVIQGQEFIGNVYSFAITGNGAPVLNLLPVVKLVTGECGFYDTVSGGFFSNAGTGALTCPAPTTGDPMEVLLYPMTVDDKTVNDEIAAMQAGMATTSPSAIAALNISGCADTFPAGGTGVSACLTSVLSETAGEIYTVSESETYNYKLVLYTPSGMSPVWLAGTLNLGLASSAQGIVALNWDQQLAPYIDVTISANGT